MNHGKITKYYEKEGYGLIVTDEGSEMFFYAKDLEECCKNGIKEGERIEFDPQLWNHFHAVHMTPEHKELEEKVRSEQK